MSPGANLGIAAIVGPSARSSAVGSMVDVDGHEADMLSDHSFSSIAEAADTAISTRASRGLAVARKPLAWVIGGESKP